MKERPILFNTDMVRVILDGRKTQTRRLVTPRFREGDAGYNVVSDSNGNRLYIEYFDEDEGGTNRYMQPPCFIGDHLYVREAFAVDITRTMYRANYGDNEKFYQGGREIRMKWKPSIHMPKERARIWLCVKRVQIEKLQEITEENARREGCADREEFARVWNGTVRAEEDRWEGNPWVWAITFERI